MCPFINLRSKIEFMHLDARELDDNTVIEGDLCIVGAGAAEIQRDRSIILCAHADCTYLEGQQVIGAACAPLLIR